MHSCRDNSALISRGLDKPLSLGERISVRLHVMLCTRCRNFQTQAHFIRKAARRFGGDPEGRLTKKP